MRTSSASVPLSAVVFVYVLSALTVGCSDSGLRAAKGKVVSNGQPVTVGSVTFTPVGDDGQAIEGKPASATVGPDGAFVLSTNKPFDGAALGKHRVTYQAPEGEDEEQTEEEAPEGSAQERAKRRETLLKRRAEQKTRYVQKAESIVEVKDDGENDFTIEVVPARK